MHSSTVELMVTATEGAHHIRIHIHTTLTVLKTVCRRKIIFKQQFGTVFIFRGFVEQ